MSRALGIFLAALLWAATAVAQTAPPTVHPGTKLGFPPTLGGAQFLQSSSGPAGAAIYRYGINKMQITVDLFDNGRRIPFGSDNPAVFAQFATDLSEIERSVKAGDFTNFERPAVSSLCTYGGTNFRCIVCSARGATGRLFSKLLLTGYHDHFLRIRIDWSQGIGQTVGDADQALQAFITALVH
jgi:hypothetical protein